MIAYRMNIWGFSLKHRSVCLIKDYADLRTYGKVVDDGAFAWTFWRECQISKETADTNTKSYQ